MRQQLVPIFIEQTSHGGARPLPLFNRRVVFLGTPIDDVVSNLVTVRR
jgi:hypothetical protein